MAYADGWRRHTISKNVGRDESGGRRDNLLPYDITYPGCRPILSKSLKMHGLSHFLGVYSGVFWAQDSKTARIRGVYLSFDREGVDRRLLRPNIENDSQFVMPL